MRNTLSKPTFLIQSVHGQTLALDIILPGRSDSQRERGKEREKQREKEGGRERERGRERKREGERVRKKR
jgi:hypothetical protein